MNIAKLIAKTTLPASLQADAVAALQDAEKRARGLLWAKWKVRLFKSRKIAKMLTWESERLIDIRPDLIDWDVAPVINVTCYGDNIPWDPATGRPVPGQWLNKDPESQEFKDAVAACYWSERNHPRSYKSHKAQYFRNGGEGRAWTLGMPVDATAFPVIYDGENVRLLNSGNAWQVIAFIPLIGSFGLRVSVGHEIANVWVIDKGAQGHYPLPGYELRAPLTWSILPGRA